MTRTIVSVFTDTDHVSFNLYQSPGDIADARNLYPFCCKGNEQPFGEMSQGQLAPDSVTNAGALLFSNLASHPAVSQALESALASPQDSIAPIYIYLNADQAESLPWETLYSPHTSFLALDKRWPIARIADSSAIIPVIERTLNPPLKILVVLSAAGIDAMPEWQALFSALQTTPVDLSIQVFVCQDELYTAITSLHDSHLQVEYLADKASFFAIVASFAPHIMHFFCHGSVEGGTHLQLATRADWQAEDARGSICIDANELREATCATNTIWLVTLNSCLGAAAIQNAHSIARSLVTQGFPAVVGMREVIDSNDAHIFCNAFYHEIMQVIRQCLLKPDSSAVIEWATTLQAPRARLCDLHAHGLPQTSAAAATKEWTLPIIYVRPEPFTLRIRATNSHLNAPEEELLLAELNKLREGRTFMLAIHGIPQNAFNEVNQRIMDLENQLYTPIIINEALRS